MQVSTVRGLLAQALRDAVVVSPRLTVFAYVPDASPPLPAAYVVPVDGEYAPTYGGTGCEEQTATFTVVLLASKTDDISSQRLLDSLLASCRAALADLELADLEVSAPRWSNYGWRVAGDATYLGVELAVTVTGGGD